jgi:hypothetical protein
MGQWIQGIKHSRPEALNLDHYERFVNRFVELSGCRNYVPSDYRVSDLVISTALALIWFIKYIYV